MARGIVLLRIPQAQHIIVVAIVLRSKARSAVAIRGVGLRGVGVLSMVDCSRAAIPWVVGKGRGGAGDGVFDVEHWVIGAGGDIEAVGAEVEQREEGGCEPSVW